MQKHSTVQIQFTNGSPMTPVSLKFKLRQDRIVKGYGPLILQVFINRKKCIIDLRIRLGVDQWDSVGQRVRGKSIFAEETNLLLDEIRNFVHRIKVEYGLSKKPLTVAVFQDAFLNRHSREYFNGFYYKMLMERYNAARIEHDTYRQHLSVWNVFNEFKPHVQFAEINAKLLEDFETFLRKRYKAQDYAQNKESYHENTIWAKFKTLRTYIYMAREAGIRFEDPFQTFKFRRGSGRIIYLSAPELQSMISAWRLKHFTPSEQHAISVFLFSCYTSMRISDIKLIRRSDILENTLVFRPQKTIKKNKVVRIPLNNMAREIIDQCPDTGNLFCGMVEQTINKLLKNVAEQLGIRKKLSMHVGRHTFATEFLRRGGQLHVLKELMGHTDIKTTMVYVHLDNSHAEAQMTLMND